MKTLRFIVLGIAAALVGFAAMCVMIAMGASDTVAIAAYVGVSAVAAVALGVFDMGAKRDSIKHTSIKDSARYGQTAIFVGTACLFVGTPQECEEVADDLWHYAQQAEVRELDGTETFDVL